jgi:Transcription termination factor nusG
MNLTTAREVSTAGGSPWYVLTAKPQHEKIVSLQLRTKGVDQYLPLYSTKRQRRDRAATVELPLFSSVCVLPFHIRRPV